MGNLLETLPQGGRVAIIRLRSLGDCVLTTPAIQLLKRYRNDLEISVVVEDRFRDIFGENPDVSRILPPEPGALRRMHPELCLNFHGGTRSAWMTAFSGARLRAGFGHFRWQSAYNQRIPRAQQILGVDRQVHTAEHLASAMFWLGVPVTQIPRARLVAQTYTGREACATIHPVAATASKTWSAAGFLEVARYLQANGTEPVFIGGPGDDLSPFRDFRRLSGAPLNEIKSLLKLASFFIGNDSGPAHMAAAFGVPSVVIFGDSDPAIWGPWRTSAEVISNPSGIGGVRVEQVLAALTRLRVHA
ncbi:MAG TPA: glycosyltransferase family 9 protein [Bryobacteraceae bacterium]|nr:glycosyltransferase family 9 protein [Bryobacteraceae bacterium]